MAWRIEFDRSAERQLERLGTPTQRRIQAYLNDLLLLESPRMRGKRLTGERSHLWRYRVGDYRLICQIRDSQLLVLVVAIGHRRVVYDR